MTVGYEFGEGEAGFLVPGYPVADAYEISALGNSEDLSSLASAPSFGVGLCEGVDDTHHRGQRFGFASFKFTADVVPPDFCLTLSLQDDPLGHGAPHFLRRREPGVTHSPDSWSADHGTELDDPGTARLLVMPTALDLNCGSCRRHSRAAARRSRLT
ncbi:hypothetical protein ACFXDH_08810 [Streptomyces sp. NPDC059467]|uniref:hypothetical protein n=1 Tax=Streptomyces sp. NPDC059467 TaxID=3346844 RepID=UPI0036AAB250